MKSYKIWARFGVLAALFSGAACWGDVEIRDGAASVENPTGAGGGAEMGTGALGPCEPDDVQCVGADLQRCVTLGNGIATGWLTIQQCDSAALCQESPAMCRPAACSFGSIRCNEAVPERCSEDLTTREPLGTCAGVAYCSPVASACEAENKQAPCCLETPCEAGELRCNNGELERCRADRSGLDPVATCATQKLCELGLEKCQGASCACEPSVCDAGTTRCTGATLERCNADQTAWERVDDCATHALCEETVAQKFPACIPQVCDVGEHFCAGAVLQICNQGQTDFEDVTSCTGGPAFCDPAGRCRDVPCAVGEMQCNGAQPERCRADQSGFDPVGVPCATPQLCGLNPQGAAVCTPPSCGPNQFQCSGAQPQRCNAGQTAFVNSAPACLRAELCSVPRQRCDFCFPNRRECTPDLRSSRTCAPDGNTFGPLTFCPLGCVAASGDCQRCTPGEYRCQGGSLSRCALDGVSFTPLNRAAECNGATQVSCNGNQLQNNPCGALGCNAQRAACNECTGQQRSCADTTSFVSCQPNGTFSAPTPCGAGLLCAGAGQCACTPGQPSCNGDTLQVCNPAGNNLVPGARCSGTNSNVLRTCVGGELTTNTCASAALCDAATGASCPACVEGERSCVSGQPQVCTNGQRVPATPCGPGFLCEGAGLCRCGAGDVRCNAGALVECAANRQTFNPTPSCVGATLRSCSGNDRNDDQTCGSNALCQASSGGVCASCLPNDPVTCQDLGTEIRCVDGELQPIPCNDIDLSGGGESPPAPP
jgi:hypothetical protein